MNNFTHNARKQVCIIVAAAAVCGALASAAHAGDAPQLRVRYADLNLGTSAGATVLYQRIRRAAETVCAMPNDRELAAHAVAKACSDRAIAAAVATVGNENLTKVYAVKSGAPAALELVSR